MRIESNILRVIKLFSIAVIMSFTACTPEVVEEELIMQGEKAMNFIFDMPDDGRVKTRVKESFKDGDVIYLSAKVKVSDNTDDIIKATILTYSGNSWKPKDEEKILTWPANAISATFTAYFLPTITTGVTNKQPAFNSTETSSSVTFDLQDLRESTDDPLMAKVIDIPHNGVVHLQFGHMTSKLAFTGLKHESDTIKFYNSAPDFTFLDNQITFSFNPATGFTHQFSNNGKNYLAMPKTASETAVFFLNVNSEWATNMDHFYLHQLKEDNEEVIPASSLKNTNMSIMQKGRFYRIYFLLEQTNPLLKEEQNWHKVELEAKKFNSEDQIKQYFTDLANNGGVLGEDLDFNFIPLSEGIIEFKSLMTKGITISKSFNGNYHTIRNINAPNGLFKEIPQGVTIENLKLENMKVGAENSNYAGLLAPVNKGIIKNVRISGNNNMGTNNVPYVGGLVGLNQGTITNVEISGAVTIDAYADNLGGKYFAVGGLVGVNENQIKDSNITAAAIITTAGELVTDAYIGGFAGFNAISKSIEGSGTNVKVNAQDIKAGNCHVGGFIGFNRGKLTKCDATGDVKGGTVFNMNYNVQRTTAGGFIGYITSDTELINLAIINGCSASGKIIENPANPSESNSVEIYVGGFCGFSEVNILNCSSVGSLLLADNNDNPSRKAGALVGLISADKTISNSFSMTECNNGPLKFSSEECKTNNSHYLAKMLNDKGEATTTTANVNLLNSSGESGFYVWRSNSSYFGGAPYLYK